MAQSPNLDLDSFLRESEGLVLRYLEGHAASKFFQPPEFRDAVWSYVSRPAKRLRPAVLLMSCGAVGGSIDRAIPAAASVELFHTWTLVHDDVIDNDNMRRGGPTVHAAVAARHRLAHPTGGERADEYGRDIAILTGDMQHGWSIALMVDGALERGVDPCVVLRIVRDLQTSVLGRLIEGEIRDVQYAAVEARDWLSLSGDAIVEMLWLKTGVLYEFAAMAGAMIGLNLYDADHPLVGALRGFAAPCGIAFQLQDDILGVVGDESTLGKPVGSDIREGKKTLIVLEALRAASSDQRRRILSVLGNRGASAQDVNEVTGLLRDLGGVARTEALARDYVGRALPHLQALPETGYRELLREWANRMVYRKF